MLLGCLFVYMGGYWLVGRYQQYAVKKEIKLLIKKKLLPHEVTHFEFALSKGQPIDRSFTWEDDHEFRYKGKMYDVIGKKISNGKLYITCINDYKEKELIDHYTDIAKKQNSKPGNSNPTIQLMLSLTFISPQTYLTPSLNISSLLPVSAYQFRLLNRSSEILIPPPQV